MNVADRLTDLAQQRADDIAIASANGDGYDIITFGDLDHDATLLARGLVAMGVQPGHRIALLVKPGVSFVTLVFAVLRSGATMVLVDAGLGRKNIVRCLELTKPDGFIGIPQAQALRVLLRKRFPNAKLNVTVGRRWFWGGQTLDSLQELGNQVSSLPHTNADDPAAIVFTSGSTGPPKGVLYRQETFVTQADEIQRQYGLAPGGSDLACFPLFGLFNVACGVTTVMPEMDFSRPASCDPQKLFRAASDWKVTQAFASPAVWDRLSRHAESHGDSIPTLRQVFSCGAPVPSDVIRRTLAMVHADAELHTPYGATESLPVATIEAQEILTETADRTDQGAGVCVGKRFDSIDWRVIRISDDPIATIDQTEELPTGEIGELIVRGPQVSRRYIADCGLWNADSVGVKPEASAPGSKDHNALAKIADGDQVWHRLGDVGYLDDQERFWYCGRKSHRVVTAEGTLFTECVEAIANTHPFVARTALVNAGGADPSPTLIVEVAPEHISHHDEIVEDLQARLPGVRHVILRQVKLPTDVRHNSKINRELLAVWAAKTLGK